MADDYEYEGDWADMMDDGWLYVEDEFDLADELAENQVPDPGYAGTSHELALDDYEFDLYAYFDDLEYGDDSYWDYERRPEAASAGQKRKRGAAADGGAGKRRKPYNRETEPMLFRSRDERNTLFSQDAPRVDSDAPFAFLADWRERFAGMDGIVAKEMPADMKRAAEAQMEETPEKRGHFNEDGEDEGDWEDYEGDEEDEEAEEAEGDEEGDVVIDPDMLKEILKQKLGEAGLEGMDEDGFMDTLKMMLAGEGGADDAAGMLANSLLGKVTSDTGDEALFGWLSKQGVSLENDDDASSVATTEQQEPLKHVAPSKQRIRDSPPDSAVSGVNGIKDTPREMPLHDNSPTVSSNKKKRPAPVMERASQKKSKKVSFDVSPSSTAHAAPGSTAADASEDELASEPSITNQTGSANRSAVQANNKVSTDGDNDAHNGDAATTVNSNKSTRKRKATSAEAIEEKPVQKKARSKELQDLEHLPSTPPPGPPSRRTKNARAKAGK